MKIIMITLMFQIIFMGVTFSQEITVFKKKGIIKIDIQKNKILYTERGTVRKLIKKKCNQAYFDKFENTLYKFTKKLITIKKRDVFKGALKVNFGRLKKIALLHTETGRYFEQISSDLMNLRITSKRVCLR